MAIKPNRLLHPGLTSRHPLPLQNTGSWNTGQFNLTPWFAMRLEGKYEITNNRVEELKHMHGCHVVGGNEC